jgi:hypothetical protein
MAIILRNDLEALRFLQWFIEPIFELNLELVISQILLELKYWDQIIFQTNLH